MSSFGFNWLKCIQNPKHYLLTLLADLNRLIN